VFWNDELKADKWDTPNSEERAAENELPAIDKPEQLAELLGVTIPQLKGMAYHRDAATSLHYVRFTIPKRDGTERPIWAPKKRLKAAQRWILHNVVERLRVHGAVHGFFAGRPTVTNAAPHLGSALLVKFDLKDFFPTVHYYRVIGLFASLGYTVGDGRFSTDDKSRQVAPTLARLCCYTPDPKKWGTATLPQGAPTSPAITNVLCRRLDRRIAGWARKHGFTYTRYADDLTFSAKDAGAEIGSCLAFLRKVVAAEGFHVHPDKVRVVRRGGRQEVTGVVVNERPQMALRLLVQPHDGTPAFEVERIAYDSRGPFEYTLSTMRADRYEIRSTLYT